MGKLQNIEGPDMLFWLYHQFFVQLFQNQLYLMGDWGQQKTMIGTSLLVSKPKRPIKQHQELLQIQIPIHVYTFHKWALPRTSNFVPFFNLKTGLV